MSKPYTDIKEGRFVIWEFDNLVESDELVWHRDKKTRVVTVLEGTGWMFQMDNNIPISLEEGDVLTIPEMTYHRLYKAGTTPLKIQIKEPVKRFIEEKWNRLVHTSKF